MNPQRRARSSLGPALFGVCLLATTYFVIFLLRVEPKQAIAGVYINLDSRNDRRDAIEKQLSLLDFPVTRIPAVDLTGDAVELAGCWDLNDTRSCAGKLGCKRSHIAALRFGLNLNVRALAVFEDDFSWLPGVEPVFIPRIVRDIDSHFPNWSVIALSANLQLYEVARPLTYVRISKENLAKVMRLHSAQTTHGYIVRHQYIPTIISNFAACDVKARYEAAIDRCWKVLQISAEWYSFLPQLGTQSAGFSDIEQRFVSYNIA